MKNSDSHLKNAKKVMAVGIIFSLIFGSIPYENLSLRESWQSGISPIYVGSGLLLTFLGYFHHQKKEWAKWFIIAWCPLSIAIGVFYIFLTKIEDIELNEVLFEGIPIAIIWVSAMYYTLIYKEKC